MILSRCNYKIKFVQRTPLFGISRAFSLGIYEKTEGKTIPLSNIFTNILNGIDLFEQCSSSNVRYR
jgi:hypothetical protein